MPTNFIETAVTASEEITVEAPLRLYSAAKPDREPVKILVIGSMEAVNIIIHQLHRHRFAEPFEWTQFLSTDRPVQLQRQLSL